MYYALYRGCQNFTILWLKSIYMFVHQPLCLHCCMLHSTKLLIYTMDRFNHSKTSNIAFSWQWLSGPLLVLENADNFEACTHEWSWHSNHPRIIHGANQNLTVVYHAQTQWSWCSRDGTMDVLCAHKEAAWHITLITSIYHIFWPQPLSVMQLFFLYMAYFATIMPHNNT